MASFITQADALFRKNLTYQRRNIKQNVVLITAPALLCLLMMSIQNVVNSQLDDSKYKCGCKCINSDRNGTCINKICGIQFSNSLQALSCMISKPKPWPVLLQVPGPRHRATGPGPGRFQGLPDGSCLNNLSCPVTSLFTGENKAATKSLVRRILFDTIPESADDFSELPSLPYLGTSNVPGPTNFVENGFITKSHLYLLLPLCLSKFNFNVSVSMANITSQHEVECLKVLYLWRNSSSEINKELFQGYYGGNPARKINEILSAYDFHNTSAQNLNVHIWYNSTYANLADKPRVLRVLRSVNMVSNAFLHEIKDKRNRIVLKFIKEMPRQGTKLELNMSVMLGSLLYSWVIQLLLPVFLVYLVNEKQQNHKKMMKVHGLASGPHLSVNYGYFLIISFIYMLWFAIFGYIIGLDIFKLNNYSIQFLFYLLYLNLQIALSFLLSFFFSKVQTAAVIGYIYVFGSGLLGSFLFQYYIEDPKISRRKIMIMEIFPGFSLFGGIYELLQSGLDGHYTGNTGLNWKTLMFERSPMKDILIIIAAECFVLICISYYLEIALHKRNNACNLCVVVPKQFKNNSVEPTVLNSSTSSVINIDEDNSDIQNEIFKVENLLRETDQNYPIICHNLEKIYDGNVKKYAINNLSLAVAKGECVGLLGPSGTGKTTLINMVTGLIKPTSGVALVGNKDIKLKRDNICSKIGVCPQQDLIWEHLTGKEHLMFYGRLRNLQGTELRDEVDNTLKSLDLYNGNVGNRIVKHYSGGMKRRLSVGISLIGGTQAVFLDEPSTGLDPESRYYLWKAIKTVKSNRAIILTTHSMEEAEHLCDRIGIIVSGQLQCIGTVNELKNRYGGSYRLTVSSDPIYKKNVEHVISNLCINSIKIYDLVGTQRYQLPRSEVRVGEIFKALENLKREVEIKAFEVASSSLEDIFTEVVKRALQFKHYQDSL